jgi:chorismate synthase
MFSAFSELKVKIFGSSHADEIGVEIGGLPKGEPIDLGKVQEFVDRRIGKAAWDTPRREPDRVEIRSGVTDGKTDGKLFCAAIKNTAARSGDYEAYKNTPRPSHADYVATVKDGEGAELAGGGRFSGRMTAPICIAGAIAAQMLARRGVRAGAYVSEIGSVKGESYDGGKVTCERIENASRDYPCALANGGQMAAEALSARERLDSVGGKIECAVFGAPKGLGNALFEGLEGRFAAAFFAIPAVKAVECGLGADFAEKSGSAVNDAFYIENGGIGTLTNNNGGINGGISNGMPITFRVTLKPTPSIGLPQKTVNLATKENTVITIKGRHDACIVPRAVPAVEACASLVMLDVMLEEKKF